MTGLQFTASIVSSLAWPAAVMVAVVLLRRELADAFRRMLHLKFPGGEVTFGPLEPIAEVLAATVRDDGTPEDTAQLKAAASDEFAPLMELTQLAPAQAVIYAWGLLEYQLNSTSDRIAPDQPHGWPAVASNLKRLDKWPLIFPAINELRRLRDYTVESGSPPSTPDAVRYVSLASDLVATLRTATETSGNGDDDDDDDDEDSGGGA